MKSSKVRRHCFFFFSCQMSSLTRVLLGICVFLFEIHESQETSGLSWSSYTTLIATVAATASTASVAATSTVVSPEAPEENGIPQFHSPQLRLTVKHGDRVILPCKIHNLGNNHVIWRHGTNVLAGTNVSTYSDKRIQLRSDLSLEINGVTRDDHEGEWSCWLAGDGAFPRPGLIHSITVHDAPTVSLITPTQLSVIEGENVTIGCIPDGNPLPKDGHVPTAIPKSMLHLHRITLVKVTGRHTGLYVCEADNGVGRPAVGAVYVRVLHTPEIEIPKRRVHGGVGYKAELTCIVHSDPPAEVKWRIGQETVNMSDRIYTDVVNHNEHILVLNPVKEYDFNTYTCEANNSRGYDIRHIEFTGVPNPPIISRWETQILVKGTVNGDRTTEGTLIEEEISVTLFWAVECKSSLIDYRLHFRADIRNELNGKNEDRTPPWTELTIPADQSSTAFLHTKTFTLRGLKPSTIYETAIKARNKYGLSPLSDVCYFSTFPNSSSAKQQEFEGSLQKWRESMRSDGKGGLIFPSKDEIQAGLKSSQAKVCFSYSLYRICFGVLLLSLLPVICKYSGLD